jgi:hypothetical protein
MSYPALVNATDPAVTVTGSELPAGYTDEQIFVVTPSPAWHEVNSAGAETMIPLGSSGPFLVQIDDERILCSSFTPGGFTAVWWADPDSGRAGDRDHDRGARCRRRRDTARHHGTGRLEWRRRKPERAHRSIVPLRVRHARPLDWRHDVHASRR